VDYVATSGENITALRGVDFELNAGESIGLLGESGSGKSTLALALLHLLPENAKIIAGNINYRGQDFLRLSPAHLRATRGAEISLISQEPALALNPVLPVGRQISDVLQAHSKLDRPQLADRTKAMLEAVGFADPDRILRAYPHQLSGGQRQRVAIAQALVCRPAVVIADEPLSSLDTATQVEILTLLQKLRRELSLAMIFITHDAGVLSSVADHIIIMRNGQALTSGTTAQLRESSDPYMQGLLFPTKIVGPAKATTEMRRPAAAAHTPPLLEVRNVCKRFIQRRMLSRRKFTVEALDTVSLHVHHAETIALVGRSGSGKTTLARCIAGFETPDSGTILLEGSSGCGRHVQMIFQDSATSLNPGFTATQIIAEPLEIARWRTAVDRNAMVVRLMEEVGLEAVEKDRLAQEFSGGQRQRLALARALTLKPKLLILDEALTGLDMPLRARMIQLLLDLQTRRGLAYLYVSHDLSFVSMFAKEVAVMHEGKIVETIAPNRLVECIHPATRELMEASAQLHAPGLEATV